MVAVTKINTMIMSNNAPDILDLTELPSDTYYRKGLIENLIPYFENDRELSKEDFFWNVFEAMSVDGGLPYITDSVDIRTLAVPKEYADGKTSWAFSDLTSFFILIV